MAKRTTNQRTKQSKQTADRTHAKSQMERITEITQQLEEGIQNLFESAAYKTWLDTMSRFHDYSLNNTLLIASQKPDATLVAGYTAWQKTFGRQVNKGEKAIRILAPAPYKRMAEVDKVNPETGEILTNPDGSYAKETKEIVVPAFKVVSVFDVSQTEGRELPTLGVDELTGDVAQYDRFFEALKQSCPVPIGFEQISTGAKGYFHTVENRIALQENMSQVQTVKTLIHEMAHQKLHSIDPKETDPDEPKLTRNSKEVEAESVAYTICQHFGIDSSDYSFAYIAGWSKGKDTPELKASLNRIRSAANDMITEISAHMAELEKAYIWEHLTAEDVKDVQCTDSQYYPQSRMAEHELNCEIAGETVALHFTVSQHDDGEGFTIHSEGKDIWEIMPEAELRKLEPVLQNAVEYHSWDQRIQNADTVDDVRDVRYGIMETENLMLSGEQIQTLYEAIGQKESQLLEETKDAAERPSVLSELYAKAENTVPPARKNKAKEEER